MRFSDVGWTDITATTALASVVLKALGYKPEVQVLSVPVTYASLKNKDIDVFLGNWMPTMEADLKPYRDDKFGREVLGVNLEGAKYTLAVTKYLSEAGVKDFADIAKTSEKLDSKITASSPATTATAYPGMIEDDSSGSRNRTGRVVRAGMCRRSRRHGRQRGASSSSAGRRIR